MTKPRIAKGTIPRIKLKNSITQFNRGRLIPTLNAPKLNIKLIPNIEMKKAITTFEVKYIHAGKGVTRSNFTQPCFRSVAEIYDGYLAIHLEWLIWTTCVASFLAIRVYQRNRVVS